MLKSYGRKTVLSVAGATFACLVVLLVVAQQQRRLQVDETSIESEVGMRSLQSLRDLGAESRALTDSDSQGAQNAKGFSAYFSKLSRGRREVEKPTLPSNAATDATPAEDISADDVFIAVKTTKKFHRSRLDLLLDTWISRNMQQVSGHYHATSEQYCFLLFFFFVARFHCNPAYVASAQMDAQSFPSLSVAAVRGRVIVTTSVFGRQN